MPKFKTNKKGDFTVVIPPGTESIWHSPYKTLLRGAFSFRIEAETWAKKHLKGSEFTIRQVA